MKFSVGIPAFNESQNIGFLIDDLLRFDYGRHTLGTIVVYDDGSDDGTDSIVNSYAARDSRVRLVRGRLRQGSNAGWNYLFKSSTEDCLVKLDADIRLEPSAIERIVDALDSGFDMAFGYCEPVAAKQGVFLKAARFTVHSFRRLQQTAIGAHFARGCLLGLRTEIARKIEIPLSVIANDHYVAYALEGLNGRWVFVPDAVCYFAVATNFTDYRKQSTRASVGERQLQAMGFPAAAPASALLRALTAELSADPVGALVWLVLYAAARLWPARTAKTSQWSVASTTKKRLPP